MTRFTVMATIALMSRANRAIGSMSLAKAVTRKPMYYGIEILHCTLLEFMTSWPTPVLRWMTTHIMPANTVMLGAYCCTKHFMLNIRMRMACWLGCFELANDTKQSFFRCFHCCLLKPMSVMTLAFPPMTFLVTTSRTMNWTPTLAVNDVCYDTQKSGHCSPPSIGYYYTDKLVVNVL